MEFPLPIKGESHGFPVDKNPPLTSGYLNNVRATDVLEKRIRIGQRPGQDKWGNGDQIGGAEQPLVFLCIVSKAV